MSIGTMTSKGQITIPRAIRKDLNLHTGAKVEFTWLKEGAYALSAAPASASIMDLRGVARREGPPMTLEDMDAAIVAGALESVLESVQ
ncbi:MAG: AbrB/MazE/SpoVT family DNA-binding domain-containing protein [Cellulomonadaceae bacterium]|jgi:AbrB family looped-hinge helix DNA binding protein|nr:AbrB/MazE/SpoVT family DNA-binding domain-containing protein [Cellulomonadaceae bacterium]